MIDIVEPYVTIQSVGGKALEDDIVPLRRRVNRSCMKSKAFNVPATKRRIKIDWTVGGGFSVDNTAVLYAKWSDLPESFDGESQPTDEAYETLLQAINGNSSSIG